MRVRLAWGMQSGNRAPEETAFAPVTHGVGVDLARESVVGEEDPGACEELSIAAAAPKATGMARGDGAPADTPGTPGTPGTGEAVCPRCGGGGCIDCGA